MIGANIKKLRMQRGMTQKNLADKLFVSAQAVSRWENNEVEPSIGTILEMAKIFDVTSDEILGLESKEASAKTETCETEQEIEEAVDEPTDIVIEKEEPKAESDDIIYDNDLDIDSLTFDDICLILSDQQDLYSEEELKQLKARFNELRNTNNAYSFTLTQIPQTEEKEKPLPKKLPERLICPKCDAENPGTNKSCAYCGYDFFRKEKKKEQSGSVGCLGYFIAFLFPLIGIIWGLVKNDKGAIIFSLVCFLLNIFFSALAIAALFA